MELPFPLAQLLSRLNLSPVQVPADRSAQQEQQPHALAASVTTFLDLREPEDDEQQEPVMRSRWPFKRRRSKGQIANPVAQRWFPCELCSGEQCQQVVAVGTKIFGCASLPMARLYDFALFAAHPAVARAQLAAEVASTGLPPSPEALALRLCHSHDIETTLCVRAARNLPVALLSREYTRILRRRLKLVGGSPSDPALRTLVEAFRVDRLPSSIMSGSSVKKGAMLTFSLGKDGMLVASAAGQQLASVQSEDLAAAVRYLFIGTKHPVSKQAARTATSTLGEWLQGRQLGSESHPVAACSAVNQSLQPFTHAL